MRGEDAYQTLKEEILSGHRPTGEWLREEDLARHLGISRTPIREALRRLNAEGVVEYMPRRGVQVRHWSAKDLEEIFALRAILEPFACQLAALSDTVDADDLDAQCAQMDAICAVDPVDAGRMTDLNNQFHHSIAVASGSPRLVSLIESVVNVPLRRQTFAHYDRPTLAQTMSQHRSIAQAIRAKDPTWAYSMMVAHIHTGRSVAISALVNG